MLFVTGVILVGCGILFGIWAGTSAERNAWVTRARPGASHYCGGKFYVIMEEGEFVREYQLREHPSSPVHTGDAT